MNFSHQERFKSGSSVLWYLEPEALSRGKVLSIAKFANGIATSAKGPFEYAFGDYSHQAATAS